jgi:hypothetical protein
VKFKQKFQRGQRVAIAAEMPPSMSHFAHNTEAIVEYSDWQYRHMGARVGNGKTFQYSLLILDPKATEKSTESGIDWGHTGPFSCAWYEENQLSLVSDDRESGKRILEQHWHKGFES